MDQLDKFWEDQEKEIREAMKKRIVSKKPHLSCGTPTIVRNNQKKIKQEPNQ